MNVEMSTKIPVEMATTDQLMNVIKRINPFEATFREANKALKRGEYQQVSVANVTFFQTLTYKVTNKICQHLALI